MIENQRTYQLIHSKMRSQQVARLVGFGAKMIGIVLTYVATIFLRKRVESPNISAIKKEMEGICKKPECEKRFQSLMPQDDSVCVSVIVPVHNAQAYLTDCIESILNQNTSRSLELILVEDHSTDDSMLILEQYKEIFPQIKVVKPFVGGSAARARNEGLRYAVGQYILFVDSDDKLMPNAIETLADAMDLTEADIVQGGWQYLYPDGGLGPKQQYAEAVYIGKKRAMRLELPGMPWGKLYKRKLFEEIRFPSGYTCFEDTIVHFLLFRKAEVVTSIAENIYLWRKNPQGITATSQSSTRAVQSYWIVEEMLAFDAQLSLPKDSLYVMCVIGQLTNFCYVNIKDMDEDIQKKIFCLCCDLYEKAFAGDFAEYMTEPLPYALRLGSMALRNRRFDLWKLQGKLYQLIR